MRTTSQSSSRQSDVQQQVREAINDANQAARDAANQARQAANQARDAARAARGADAQGGGPARAPGTIVIPTDGGDDIQISVDGQGIHVSQDGQGSTTIPINQVIPRGVTDLAYASMATLVLLVVGTPIARAFARWLDRRNTFSKQSTSLSADVQARLDAMERNIDTVAVELERVSEGQRFTNKLLSERPQMPMGAPAERVPVEQTRR